MYRKHSVKFPLLPIMYDGRLFFFGAIIAVFAVTTSFSIESGFLTGWQGNNAGGATCNFLMLPVSGAALSQGFISFPGSIDAADVANFPANLALNYRNRFSLGHLEWFMGLRKEFMGAAFPILDVGTVGYHSQLFTPGSFKYARTIDEKVAKPSLLDYTLGMMFAKPLFNDRLGIGLSASYLESRLDALKANAWYTTMDLLFHPAKWWSVRGYIRHLGTPVNYGSYDERLPMQLGAIKTITWHQPVSDSLDNPPIRAECGLGIQKTAYEPIQLSVAAQYHLGPYVTLRSGYEYRYNSPLFPIGFSAGIGVSYGKYGIDGGWKYQSEDFGSVWAANITMQLEEIVPQTAREYLAHAQHHFDKNQFWISRYYARKALQRNPNLWHAYSLLHKVRSKQLQKVKREVALVYAGNVNGYFLPNIYDKEPSGGLAKQAAIIKQLREEYPLSLSVNVGNMITPSMDPFRIKLADDYAKHMQFDILCLGTNDIHFGVTELFKKHYTNKMLCTNCKTPFIPSVIKQEIIKCGAYRFFIASYIGPTDNNPDVSDSILVESIGELHASFLYPDARKCDVRIAVIHDSWKRIRQYTQILSEVDIIVCGNIDQELKTPIRVGSTLIISAGADGAYVGNLVMQFDKKKKLTGISNYLYPVTRDVQPDSTVADLLKAVAMKTDIVSQELDPREVVKGSLDESFPFVSSRSGKPHIYFKRIDIPAEFALTNGKSNCTAPLLSPTGEHILFLRRKTNSSCTQLEIMEPSGAGKLILHKSHVTEAHFTPLAEWIYFISSECGKNENAILRVRPEGGKAYTIISWPKASFRDITFSPDGTMLVFCSNRDGKWHIYWTNSEGEHPIRITDIDANHHAPSYSPDGNVIAYLSDKSNVGNRYDLWIYDLSTGQHRQITSNTNVKEFCWLDKGRTIVYSSGVNIYELYKTDIISKVVHPLIKSRGIKKYSERHPRMYMYNGTKKILYVRHYKTGEQQIFWVNPDGGGEHCIVDSDGSDWLPPTCRYSKVKSR